MMFDTPQKIVSALEHNILPIWNEASIIAAPYVRLLSQMKREVVSSMRLNSFIFECELVWNKRSAVVKDVVFWTVFSYAVLSVFEVFWRVGPFELTKQALIIVRRLMFTFVKSIPGIRGKVKQELAKVIGEIENSMIKDDEKTMKKHLKIPEEGKEKSVLLAELLALKELEKVDWKGGKVSGTVYSDDSELSAILNETYSLFANTNPLHPDVFPGVRKMEAEVVRMCLGIYNCMNGCGSVTSGGTESIILAVKAHRDWMFHTKGITQPEIVVPITAHAAFDKAASYLKVKIRHAPVDKNTMKVKLRGLRNLISRNTILIVGSAPQFAHGVCDDIEGLGKIAQYFRIGLHVDCCLGSFVYPFLQELGYECPVFDFRISGVTSVSCDTHKFGFAPKGSSVLMYRSPTIRHFQYFVQSDWPGGIYASPSIAGSRPGVLIAACWAAMMFTGRNGYLKAAKDIMSCASYIKDGVRGIEGIELCGNPEGMVVSFTSKTFNIYSIGDQMSQKGWNLNVLQNPPAIHICCTMRTLKSYKSFVSDLQNSVDSVRGNKNLKKGMGAIYGMAASIPDRSLVDDIARGFLDALTKVQ